LPQVGEETGAILVKVQKGPSSDIEYPRPLLDESGSRPELLQQVAEGFERAGRGMFHLEAL